MDIDYLIDRLEALITNGKRVPLGNKIMVDEQQCLDLIDQMRAVLPEEIRAAKRTLHERERILAIADEDSQHIVQRAEEERQHIIGREGLLAETERQSDIILGAANEEALKLRMQGQELYDEALGQAQEMRDGANVYAMQVLQELETVLSKHLGMVQNGLQSFQKQITQYQRELEQYHQNYRPDFGVQGGAPDTNKSLQRTAKPSATPPASTGERRPNAPNNPVVASAKPTPIGNSNAVANNANRLNPATRPNNIAASGSGALRPVPKTQPKDPNSNLDDEFLE